MANLVLICDAKKWFSAAEQATMGIGNPGPVYEKAREIWTYAYGVRWTPTVPDATSTIAKAMDSDLQAIASIMQSLESSTVSVSTILEAIGSLQKLCYSIVVNDNTWATSSGRSSVVAQMKNADSKCGLLHPIACVEDVGGALLAWAAMGAVAYFGGKWLIKKYGSRVVASTRRRLAR